jgi:chromosome segregation ATPase
MKELDELGNRLLQLKQETESQKKVIDEFKTERDHLVREIQHLDSILQGIVSTYGEKGDKILNAVKTQTNSLNDELKKRVEEINFSLSQFGHRVDSIESRLTSLDSDTDKLASERTSIQREFKILEKIKDDLSELQKWKDRAFERIDNQDAKIDDRFRELENLEKRMENALRLLGEKFEKVIGDQSENFDNEIEKLRLQMKELVDIQQAHVDKVEEEIRGQYSNEIRPRILKIDNALKQMAKLNMTFQNLKKKTEKIYQGVSKFKSNFEDTEMKLKTMMEENIRKINQFETRVTALMNELVQEYEKRFDMIRKDMDKVVRPLEIPEPLETKGEFKSKGFLNKVKNIFIKEDTEKIKKLENDLRRQKMLMKKLLLELKSATKTNSK